VRLQLQLLSAAIAAAAGSLEFRASTFIPASTVRPFPGKAQQAYLQKAMISANTRTLPYWS